MMEKEKKDPAEQTVVTQVGKVEEVGEKRAYILFLSGPLVGKLQALKKGETILGRAADANIVINDNRISRHHISVTFKEGKTTLADLGSTNGTFVNGKRIQKHILQDGDKIQLSSTTIFKFAFQDNIENVFHQELYKMAILDAVTGIYNKRYFLNRLQEEFSHATRLKQPFSLLMIDVDHFKNINDHFGHLAGDFALAFLAESIKKIVRGSDIAARFGGEEFAVILRNTEEKGAWQLAERLRHYIEKHPASFEAQAIPFTISIGIATVSEEIPSPEALLETADQYLYLSKNSGRNKTHSKNYKT